MKKRLFAAAMAGLMTIALAMPAYAGEWKQDSAGWWYQNDDASYPSNGWTWVDGKCYYFTPEGYCLMGTQTPDGYTVDASGAWVVDGVVQTQGPVQDNTQTAAAGVTVQMDTMTFTVPDGFVQDTEQTGGVFLFNESQQTAIAFISQDMPELAGLEALIESMQQQILDKAMQQYVGDPSGKDARQFSTGVWYRYDYADASSMGVPGSMNVYTRIYGTKVQMMMFAGNLFGMDTDAIMGNNLK